MEIATKSVLFRFNEVMYRQIDGICMGFPSWTHSGEYLLGFMKDYYLKSFLSLLFTYVILTTLLLVLVHVARL